MRESILGSIIPLRKFNPPTPPTAVAWESLEANGTPNSVSSTQLTATFSLDPGLTTANFVVSGASKGTVTNTDRIYTINIFDITGVQGSNVTVDLIDVPDQYSISPAVRFVSVNVADELEAPAVVNELVFPSAFVDVPFSFSIAYVFGGEVDSYAIASGTLPSWATLNTTTGEITGTPDAESTATGLSFTATNTAGTSPASNTDDLITVESVEGQGAVIPQLANFYGYEHVNITGLRINGITMHETADTAPTRICLSILDQIEFTGGRTLSSTPVRPFQDFQIEWEITFADDSPIPDNENLIVKGEAFNEFADQRKGNLNILLRQPGDYKATATVSAQNGEGFLRVATYEYLFSRAESTLPVRWADADTGLSGNDGLDPWGFELSTATYTNATKRLNQTGAFTSYDHTAATTDDRITYQYNDIYLTGGTTGLTPGLYKIAAKISNDEIELEEALGADYTNVTSSTGPKATVGTINNTHWMYKGGDLDYGTAILMYQTGRVCGYGPSKFRLINSSETQQIMLRQWGGSTGAAPVGHNFFMGNCIVDGENKHEVMNGSLATSGGRVLNYVFDDVEFKNSAISVCVNLSSTTTSVNIKRNTFLHNCLIDNLFPNRHEFTSAGNTAGSMTFTVAETVDGGVQTEGEILAIDNSGRKPYDSNVTSKNRIYFTSRTGGTFNLVEPLPSSFAEGNKVAVADTANKIFALSVSSKIQGWKTAIMFCTFDADGIDDVKDHPIYPDGYLDDLDISYNHFRKGIGCSYATNTSYSSNVQDYIHRGYTFVGNQIDDCVRFGTDLSKTNNSTDFEWSIDNYIAENQFGGYHSFMYFYSGRNFRCSHNVDNNTNGNRYGSRNWEFVHRASSTDTEFFSGVIDRNTITDRRLFKMTSNERNYELTNNTASVVGDNPLIRLGDNPVQTGMVINFNDLNSPDQPSGYVATYADSGRTLEQLNTDFSAENTSDNVTVEPTAAPDAPTGLTGTAGDTTINWSWTPSTTTGDNAATGQRFYRNTTNDFETASQVGSDLSGSATSYMDTGLTNDVAQYGWVTAFNSLFESDPSAVSTATPEAPSSDQFVYNFSEETLGSGLPSFTRLAVGSGAATSEIITTTLSGGASGKAWKIRPTVTAVLGIILDEIPKQTGDISMFAVVRGEVGGNNAILARLAARIYEVEGGVGEVQYIHGGHRPSSTQLAIRSRGPDATTTDVYATGVDQTTWFASWQKVLLEHTAEGVISLYAWPASGTKPGTPNVVFDDTSANSLANAFVGVAGINDGRVIFEYISVGINGSPAVEI